MKFFTSTSANQDEAICLACQRRRPSERTGLRSRTPRHSSTRRLTRAPKHLTQNGCYHGFLFRLRRREGPGSRRREEHAREDRHHGELFRPQARACLARDPPRGACATRKRRVRTRSRFHRGAHDRIAPRGRAFAARRVAYRRVFDARSRANLGFFAIVSNSHFTSRPTNDDD